MKVCIAYETKYGNGKKCAHYLSGAITNKGHETEVISIHEVKPNSIPKADIYVFSSPTHVGGPTGKMKKFLKKAEIGGKETKYALITTHIDPDTKTIDKMESILEPKGMTKVSDGLKIKVTGMKGPLEEGFEQKLDEFAMNILQ